MTEEYVRSTMCALIEAEGEEAQEEAIIRRVYADGFKAGVEAMGAAAIGAFEADIDSAFWDLNRIRVFINAAKLKEDSDG